MPSFVYLLRDKSGRHYLGCTDNLAERLARHQRGHTHSTLRLGLPVELVATRSFNSREEALKVERQLKSWHNPAKARAFLEASA